MLYFDSETKMWKMDKQFGNLTKTLATVNATYYPFGAKNWTIHDDPCYGTGNTKVTLNLNSCGDDEFNCVSGQCVPMTVRCDGKLNCDDRTGLLDRHCTFFFFSNVCITKLTTNSLDEMGCDVYRKDSIYIKTMPPEPLNEDNMTYVDLSLNILAILEIAEVDSYISMQIEISLSWYAKLQE